jgi:hypothetical protein
MSKTYDQYVADCRSDIESEGYERDLGVYMDIAESMLFDSAFRALAVRKFGQQSEFALKECVAHSLC